MRLDEAFLVVQLSLLLLSGFTFSASISPQASPPHYHAVSPLAPPSHPPSHHHHHHHHHPHPPTPSPTAPPTPSPVQPPVHPPTKPPTHSPPKPPTHSPPKPPVHTPPAPAKPPTKPPTHSPPVKPPTPPTKPPVKPPTPPTKPPVKPPTTPPTKPPVKPPTTPPTKPPVKPPTPPTKPPVKPPTPPTKPPAYPPSKPPTYPIPQRSLVAVQGVVYCKSCKYAGVDTLLGANPVPGATVRLTCNNTKNKLTVQLETDKNGYFFLQAPNTITNFGIKSCSVSLVSSPLKSCSKLSNLNGGLKGSPLKPEKPSATKKLPYVLYSVGPFAFEPTCS